MAEFEFKMTLLANGEPSDAARIVVTTHALTYATFPPSGNGPFKSAAYTWAVQVTEVTCVNNFLYGYMTIVDWCNRPVMNCVPFCAYIGDVWPQAPVGIVHGAKPDCVEGSFILYTVIIERP